MLGINIIVLLEMFKSRVSFWDEELKMIDVTLDEYKPWNKYIEISSLSCILFYSLLNLHMLYFTMNDHIWMLMVTK